MNLTSDEAVRAVERHPCPKCGVSVGSVCRTLSNKVTAKYHTGRFMLVPALREELAVVVPIDRRPGTTWKPGPEELFATEEPVAGAAIRIGYARCSTVKQDLEIQLAALRAAGCTRVFSEKISSRVKVRPEYDKAIALAAEIKQAAPHQPVIFSVHEIKRPARNAAELMALAANLDATGIQLELLTGPLAGIYDPNGMGAMLFAVLAVGAQLDRNYIRDKTLEGQAAAAAKGNHGGRPKVIDDDMLTFAKALRDKGLPIPEIAKKLTIGSGRNKGKHPSVASLYRALAQADEAQPDIIDHAAIPRPKPARIRMPGDPVTAEELDLRERLTAQRADLTARDSPPQR